jgi:Xaa-Pro aminopeptidase
MMTERGLTMVIAASVGFDMIDFSNPVAHLTGVRPLGPALLVLTQDEIRLLTTPAADFERISEQEPPFPWLATDDLHVSLKEMLPAGAPPRYRVGYIGLGAMPWRLTAQVREIAGPGEDLTKAFAAATGAKTPIEIDNARKATAIAEAGYRRLLESVTPGMRECDVAVDLNLFMRELGANDSFLMMHCASRSEAVMPPTERKIERGDLILVELSPAVDGQFTQICRTASVGTAALKDNYNLLVDAMLEGIAAVRPGVPMSEVCSAINRVVGNAGYRDYAHPPFIRRRGHGLGSASTWPGDVALDNKTLLERDMLFMVHPNQFLPESGYLMCGEPVLVAQAGGEVLSQQVATLGIVGT